MSAEEFDERVFAPSGLPDGASGTVTAVDGLREGRSSRKGSLSFSQTFVVVEGPHTGIAVELRLWPESNPAYFAERLCELCEISLEAALSLSLSAARRLLEERLGSSSYTASFETGSDGRADLRFIRGRREHVSVSPSWTGPPRTPRVPPPADADPRPLPAVAFRWVTTRAGVSDLCEALAACPTIALDIETDCGPIGSPASWSPRDGAVRLIQVAARIGAQTLCGVVDCYDVAPKALIRLLGDGREIVAHNARYEQEWLSFHFGLRRLTSVFDTSCAFRIFERRWELQNPEYERRDATLGTVTARLLGAAKSDHGGDWWGEPSLSAEQRAYAAYDALCLLQIVDRARDISLAFGCTEQVVAASRTACHEAVRKLPQADPAAYDAGLALLEQRPLVEAAAVIRRLPLSSGQRTVLRHRFAATQAPTAVR